jgi:hypothetical protein
MTLEEAEAAYAEAQAVFVKAGKAWVDSPEGATVEQDAMLNASHALTSAGVELAWVRAASLVEAQS